MKRLFLLVLLFPTILLSQQSQQIEEKVRVDMLQVPVWITDSNGVAVTSVKKEDLQITDNGAPTSDYFLDEITLEKGSEPASRAFPQSVLILLDSTNLSRSSLKSVKDSLMNIIKSKGSPLPIGIAIATNTASYKLIQDYTSDPQVLTAQFSKLDQYLLPDSDRAARAERLNQDEQIEECSAIRPPSQDPGAKFQSFQDSGTKSRCIDDHLRTVAIAAKHAAVEEGYRAMRSWRVLAEICQAASSVPGYKHVLFLSDGIDPAGTYFINYATNYLTDISGRYAMNASRTNALIRDLQGEHQTYQAQEKAFQELSQSAMLSRTVIHWINTDFGRTLSRSIESSGVMGSQASSGDVGQALTDAVMHSGGNVIGASKKDSADIIEQLPKLYIVGVPLKNTVSDHHEIRVASQNKAYHLAYPLAIPTAPEKMTTAQVTKLSFPIASNSISISQEANYFQKKKGQYYVILRANVPYTDLTPSKKGADMTDQLEFRFHVDGSDGKPVLEQTHKVDLKMPAAEFQLQQQGDVILEYVQSAELKSGVYNVAISVMENQNSSTMGVQKFSITLPSDSEKCLQVGPLMLASAVAPGTEQVAAPKVNDKGQILYGTNIYSMQSRRMFPATGTLNGFYEIYSASVPSVFISFKLYADGKVMSQTSEREIAAYTKPEEQIISNFFSVPYKNLAAGKYELEITARQNKTDCAQSSKSAFEVIQQPGT